ncbi:MAG: S-layer homology domain-containing protein [Candidatus Sericytochromatia bacterium]
MKTLNKLLIALCLSLSPLPALAEISYQDLLRENGGDLETDHWAATAIQELVDKYGVITGFPDKKFRGDRPATRYEMAAALYQVLKYFDGQFSEQLIGPCGYRKHHSFFGNASGIGSNQPFQLACTPDDPPLSIDEIRLLADLLEEFRNELQLVTANHLDLSRRITGLESVQIHGGLQLRYRVQESSLLSNSFPKPGDGNMANPTDQASGTFYPITDNVRPKEIAPFRTLLWLDLNAGLTDALSFSSTVNMFAPMRVSLDPKLEESLDNGHDLNEGPPGDSPFVFRKAMLSFRPPESGHEFRLGLMNFADLLRPGSGFTSLFDSSVWNGHDYGFVGWGGAEFPITRTDSTSYRNTSSLYWAGGLGASLVDPDARKYNQGTSPALAWRGSWDSGAVMFGINAGSVQSHRWWAANGDLSGNSVALQASELPFETTSLWDGAVLQGLDRKGLVPSGQLALPSQYGDGYAVLGLEQRFLQDLFPIRLQLAGMQYLNDALIAGAYTRKELSGTVDLGWNQNFGMTLQANKSFFGYDRQSLGVFLNDISGTGIDIQFGANLASRGFLNFADTAACNVGFALGFGDEQTKLILGVRQAFGDNFGAAADSTANQLFKDSGASITFSWRNFANIGLNLDYQFSMLFVDTLLSARPGAIASTLVGTYEF